MLDLSCSTQDLPCHMACEIIVPGCPLLWKADSLPSDGQEVLFFIIFTFIILFGMILVSRLFNDMLL